MEKFEECDAVRQQLVLRGITDLYEAMRNLHNLRVNIGMDMHGMSIIINQALIRCGSAAVRAGHHEVSL